MNANRSRVPRAVAVAAMALGIAGGSYGVASAASGSGSSSASSSGSAAGTATAPSVAGAQRPWGGRRGDETLLTGDTAAKLTALATAKVPGGTVVRVETGGPGGPGGHVPAPPAGTTTG